MHSWCKVESKKENPTVPSVSMENMRSLRNKREKLFALIQTQREYRESSLMCFTETWLHTDFPDHSNSVPGFTLIQVDRDAKLSGKRKDRGIAVFIIESWCNSGHVTVKECLCSDFVSKHQPVNGSAAVGWCERS